MSGEPRPSRHDLVWLAPGLSSAVRVPASSRWLGPVREWIERGRPAVARRADPGTGDGEVTLGIALPLSAGKKVRVSFTAARGAIARVEPPLRLEAVVGSAPVAWRAPLDALAAFAAAEALPLRVYGSLAWQHLTGERYVGPGSDVDVLVRPRSTRDLRRALAFLRAFDDTTGPALDGEVLLDGGRAVSWRELAEAPARVLVKSDAGVALEPTAAVLGALVLEAA